MARPRTTTCERSSVSGFRRIGFMSTVGSIPAAAGIEPTVDMNPILLKPETDDRSQVVVRGRAIASLDWRGYGRLAPTLWPVVVESLERLRAAHDLVVIEGAGNPAEINLECDLANMRVAAVAGAPVLLVGDIDGGGVFAALVGTLALLSPDDRARVAGLVVNRFRGDPSVLGPGLDLLTARTGVPVLGVVPHLGEAPLPEEDSLGLESVPRDVADARLSVAVPRLPRIANFDDLEPLAAEPGVAVRFVAHPEAVDRSDRSEEHTSELQSPCNLVCRLLLEKKKKDRARSGSLHKRIRNDASGG